MTENIQKRQPAYMVEIQEILEGTFTKTEGWDPNFVTTSFGLKVSRVSVIGTVIEIQDNAITLDDSSGIITIRSFEPFKDFDELKSGDFIMIIGKLRQFNDETYITPEICTKLSPEWIKYRNGNIQKIKELFEEGKIKQEELSSSFSSGKEVVKEIVEESIESTTENTVTLTEQIVTYIDEHDKGSGVEKVKILDHFDSKEVIDALDTLIMEGDVFEIKPGVFKVLK